MRTPYTNWMGHAVVLKLAAGDLSVPLRGVLVSESPDAVRFRIGEGWDVDIYKAMILAVEEESWISLVT